MARYGDPAARPARLESRVLPPRMRAALLNALLLLASLALGAAVSEFCFGLANRALAARGGRPHGEMAVFTRYDAILGWDGVPGVRAPLLHETVTLNARGERGPDVAFERAAGTRRVLVLGDSQAWGLGVADHETIAARLQAELSSEGASWQALNLGVSGYGTDQAYLKYLVHGASYEPDVVVWVVFKNDLEENVSTRAWGVEKPRFVFDDEGRLCLDNLPPRKAPGWPEDTLAAQAGIDPAWSETWRFLRARRWRALRTPRPDPGLLARVRADVPCVATSGTADGARVMLALLLRLEERLRARGACLRVAFVPRPIECRKPRQATYYVDVQAEAQRAGLVTLDLRHTALIAGLDAQALFLKGDSHLSAAGNALAARALAKTLR